MCHIIAGGTVRSLKSAKLYYNYLCNYCPIGNHPDRLGRPYRRGKPCGACKKHCRGKLCQNSCKSADQWSNCKQLYKAQPLWLCHTKTKEGKERLLNCMATCTCKHKIYDR
ncbi:hypothetical protein JTB14_010750 [Gonioctena quinquepunctata]|nr:hypothetical protein JTB14_010750 [Gonioctena quinquepunctata]